MLRKTVSIMAAAGFLALSVSSCSMMEDTSSSSISLNPTPDDQSAVTDSATDTQNSDTDANSAENMADDASNDPSATDADNSNSEYDGYSVEVENRTGSDMYGVQYALTGSDEWGEEYASDMLADGESATLEIPRGEDGERFDLRGYDNEEMSGDGWIFPDIDFTNDGRIILRYKDEAPDYDYE